MSDNIIPTARGGLPVVGHTLRLLREPLSFLSSLPEQGELVKVRLGPFEAVVLTDPELTRQVLLNDRSFDKGGEFYQRVSESLGNGLSTSRHHVHRRQRRLCQPAFHPSRIEGYADVMTTQITAVVDTWRDGQSVDVPAEMMKITSAALAATMFAGALPRPAMSQFMDDMAILLAGIFRRMLMPPWLAGLPTPGNRRYRGAVGRMRATVAQVVAERRAGGSTGTDDLLSALLSSHVTAGEAEAGQGVIDEVVDHALTFFIAGTETTATALAWALHLVANYPEVAEGLYSEVDTVLAGRRRAVFADLPGLDLTSRIVSETLRIYPPAWLFTRMATADVDLGHYRIPAGTTLVYSPYLIHHRADIHERPDSFDPDRWARAAAPDRRGVIPFGGGARKCIGDVFGVTEVTLALATIAAQWRLQPTLGRKVRPVAAATLRPQGLRLTVASRAAVPERSLR